MHTWSGTSRRIFVAFAAIISIFALAAYLALSGLAQIHRDLHSTRRHAEGVKLALELASAVRDQYAHQAHTIIIGDASHLGFYSEAEAHVLELVEAVRRQATSAEERAWVDDIQRATAELDGIFRNEIVPAVMQGKRADVQAEHGRAQLVVSRIQERADRLVERYEKSIGTFQDHVTAVEHRTFRSTLASLLTALGVAVGVGIYVGRSVARPVALLHRGAERLAQGDLETRIVIDTPDEFGALARQFNAMTSSLKEHQEKLVQSEKLAGIGRLAAGVAHEINNPLGVILGYTRLLQKKASGELAEDLGVIEEETLRCKEIVEGLLDLSRPVRSPPEPVDLRQVCDGIVARLRDSHQLDGIEVQVTGAGVVSGSSPKLRQVILNLLRNALEANAGGGTVRVELQHQTGQVLVAVVDSGPGVPENLRDRLFEPFFTTKPSGTGLGLAVSRAIARAHGGNIDAASATGGGAVFTLRLPATETA